MCQAVPPASCCGPSLLSFIITSWDPSVSPGDDWLDLHPARGVLLQSPHPGLDGGLLSTERDHCPLLASREERGLKELMMELKRLVF